MNRNRSLLLAVLLSAALTTTAAKAQLDDCWFTCHLVPLSNCEVIHAEHLVKNDCANYSQVPRSGVEIVEHGWCIIPQERTNNFLKPFFGELHSSPSGVRITARLTCSVGGSARDVNLFCTGSSAYGSFGGAYGAGAQPNASCHDSNGGSESYQCTNTGTMLHIVCPPKGLGNCRTDYF